MNILIGSNNCKPPMDLIKETFSPYGSEVTVLSVGVNPADDEVAKFTHDNNMEFKHITPDVGLRGNGAYIYSFRQLAADADEVILFFKKFDKDIKEMIEVANEFGIKYNEIYFS